MSEQPKHGLWHKALWLSVALGLVLAGLLLCKSGWAAQATLTWDYPSGTTITGFRGYCAASAGTWPGTPTFTTNATTKTAAVTYTGRTYCVVRAYDAAGESSDSNVLGLLEAPSNLRTASQSVQYQPGVERVEMSAKVLRVEDGSLLSQVDASAQ